MLKHDGQELYTTNEAAKMLGVLPTTVRTVIANSKMTATRIGRDNYLTKAEIERYRAQKSPTGWKAGKPRPKKDNNANSD